MIKGKLNRSDKLSSLIGTSNIYKEFTMPTLHTCSALGAFTMMIALGSWNSAFGQEAANATTAAATAPPDAGLFTTYNFPDTFQYVYVNVCGSTQETEGCYGEHTLGPFGHVGAMLEGHATIVGNVVRRHLYIVDVATGSAGNDVTLYEYEKVDPVTATDDFYTVKLKKTVPLPLLGGSTAQCFIAANHKFLFIGTDQGPSAEMVEKGNYALATIGGFSNQAPVSSISTDDYGYVTVTFGPFESGGSGFVVINPNGGGAEDGGGAVAMLTSNVGLSTSSLSTTAAVPSAQSVNSNVTRDRTR
jgi:hypothetical protein